MPGFKGYRRSIVLDFDYDSVKKGIPEVNKQMALLNAEYKKTTASIEANGNSLDKLSANQKYYTDKITMQKEKVSKLRTELETLSNSENKNGKAIAKKTIELKNAERELITTEDKLKKVNNEINKSSTYFGKASLAINDFKGTAEKMGVSLGKVESSLKATAAAAATYIAATTVMSMNFDEQFRKVRTIADESQVSFDDLRQGVLDMSKELKLAHVDSAQLAEGLYNIISANISTADSMDVLRESAKLAETGFTDMNTATDIMTTIINAYGLSVEDAGKVTDELIMIQKLGKITINELGSDFGRVAGIASTANVPLNEMGSAISVLTVNGIKSNEAITGMRAILDAVIKPTAEASAVADQLGIKFNVAAIQSKGLAGFLEEVKRKTKGNAETMAELFGGVDALNSIMILTSENGLAQFNANSEAISDSLGTADKAMTNLDDSGYRLKDSLNNLKTSMVEIGDTLSPIIDLVARVVSLISRIDPIIITMVASGIAAAKVLGSINILLPVLAATSTTAAGGLSALGIASGLSSAQIMLVAAAIAVVVGLILLLSKGSKQAANDISTVKDAAENLAHTDLDISRQTALSNVNSAGRQSYAIGTQYHRGGRALVGEYGPEEVILPVGSKVRTSSETRRGQAVVDNSKTEKLLSEILARMDKMEAAIQDQPRKQQQLLRMGVV